MHKSVQIINKVFLHSFLLLGMLCCFVAFIVDIRSGYAANKLIVLSDIGFFISLGVAYLISKYYDNVTIAVLFFATTSMAIIVYDLLQMGGYNLGIGIVLIILIGYIYSLVLNGNIRILMHLITFLLLISLLVYQYMFPEKFVVVVFADILEIGIPYIFIYLTIAYTSILLKDRLEKVNVELNNANGVLAEQKWEIETQYEELNVQQEEMNAINIKLEKLIEQRTRSLEAKNDALSRYSFNTAHHVRGPLARILGLLILSRIDNSLTSEKLIEMIEFEAKDMDIITRAIAKDLGDHLE